MKRHLLNSLQSDESSIHSLLAEMILDEALLNFRKEKIEQEIDRALCEKNKDDFLRLCKELNELHRQYGYTM